jgi:anti-anti-sigma factor
MATNLSPLRLVWSKWWISARQALGRLFHRCPHEPRFISAEYCGDIAILRIETEFLFDEETVRHIFDEVTAAIGQRPRIILEMGKIKLVSSTAFSRLITIQRKSRERGGRVILCSIIPNVLEEFRTHALDKVFQIVSTLDEAKAALSWSLTIRCPIAGCEGDGLSNDPSIADRGGEFCCRSCGCSFRVAPFQLDRAGEARVAVSRFEIPTYEHEQIRAELGGIVHLDIIGRLDLFAAEALVDAWRSLPQSRRALLDLHAATELSQPGLRTLGEYLKADVSADRVVVLVDPDRSARTRAGLLDLRVTTIQDEAMAIHRSSPGSDEPPPPLLVSARTVGRAAEQSQSRDAVTPGGERGPSPSIP